MTLGENSPYPPHERARSPGRSPSFSSGAVRQIRGALHLVSLTREKQRARDTRRLSDRPLLEYWLGLLAGVSLRRLLAI